MSNTTSKWPGYFYRTFIGFVIAAVISPLVAHIPPHIGWLSFLVGIIAARIQTLTHYAVRHRLQHHRRCARRHDRRTGRTFHLNVSTARSGVSITASRPCSNQSITSNINQQFYTTSLKLWRAASASRTSINTSEYPSPFGYL